MTGIPRPCSGCITFGCATAGNHGLSVAAGPNLSEHRPAIFVHSPASAMRGLSAIAPLLSSLMIRVAGPYMIRPRGKPCLR